MNTFRANGLVSRHTSSGSAFYAFDPQGNVAERVDGDGNITSADMYDAFGARQSTASAQPGPWGFGAQYGYYADTVPATGDSIVLCAHRFYDLAHSRWLTFGQEG